MGFNLVAMPIGPQFWDTATAQSVKDDVSSFNSGSVAPISGMGKLPATYVFKTRESGMGLLQIMCFTRKPSGVNIRYKLVLPASQARTRTAAAVEDLWRTALTLEGPRFEVTQSDEPLRNVSLTNAITVKSVAWHGWSDSGAPAAQVEIRLPEDIRWKWYWQMRVFDRAGREYSSNQFKPQVASINGGIDVNCVAEIFKVSPGDVEKILLQCRPFP